MTKHSDQSPPSTAQEKEITNLEGIKGSESGQLIVVGIGASAGGLEALQALVANLPPNSGMSFILAQHLSPSYRSMMVDLLEKGSNIPVVAARNADKLVPDTLYICPPSYNIEVTKDDKILLSLMGENRHIPRPSVDMLFESIAVAKGESALFFLVQVPMDQEEFEPLKAKADLV